MPGAPSRVLAPFVAMPFVPFVGVEAEGLDLCPEAVEAPTDVTFACSVVARPHDREGLDVTRHHVLF